jgi:hypothetical protein
MLAIAPAATPGGSAVVKIAGSIASYKVTQSRRAGNIASDDAEALCQGPFNNRHTMAHAFPLSDAAAARAIKPYSMCNGGSHAVTGPSP